MNGEPLLERVLRGEYPAPNDELTHEIMREALLKVAGEACEGGFKLVLGHELGAAIHQITLGDPDRPNRGYASSHSRQLLSKWAIRVRRNMGLGPEFPIKGIGRGRKPNAKEGAA